MENMTLKICAKTADCFAADLVDHDGKTLIDYDGYVPDFMPGQHYGDYIMIDIDMQTGQIINWKTPTAEQIEEFINNDEED